MTLLTRANCSQTCYSISVTPNGENQMGTRWYRKRNRSHKTKIILAMGKRASNLKLFKESVKIVGPQALENSRTFLTLNESLFSMIFSLDLNGISPQTISNSKTPSDQVAADLNRMLMVCSI